MPNIKRLRKGWEGFASVCVPKDAPEVQRRAMEISFYGGATVLFESIMTMLEPGVEATDADLQKMSEIADELKEFGERSRAAGFQPRRPIDPRVN